MSPELKNKVNICFLGDISLNDQYNDLYKSGEQPFSNLIPSLKKSDYVIGNLECMAESEEGENLLKKPRLKTNKETLNYLSDINLSVASLAHNHIYDNLNEGYRNTVDFLKQNSIAKIGAGETTEEVERPIIKEVAGISFCFLNYVDYDTNPNLPSESRIVINVLKEEKVIKQIAENRNYDHIILLLHWGGKYEGGLYPDWNQRKLAKKFIDAGASIIIGHHSHTFQPYEKYKGKYIFYSLGNFCFADILSDNKMKYIDRKRFNESALVEVAFSKESYKVNLSYFENKSLNLELKDKLKYKYARRRFFYGLIKRIWVFWAIYHGYFIYADPFFYQLFRKDPERNLVQRLKSLNSQKLKGLFK